MYPTPNLYCRSHSIVELMNTATITYAIHCTISGVIFHFSSAVVEAVVDFSLLPHTSSLTCGSFSHWLIRRNLGVFVLI